MSKSGYLWNVEMVNQTDRRDNEVAKVRAATAEEAGKIAIQKYNHGGWGWSLGNIWRAQKPRKKKPVAKKRVVKKPAKKTFYLSIDGDPKKMSYFTGRDKLVKSLGSKHFCGSGMGMGAWDASWYNLTAQMAKKLQAKAKRFKFVKRATICEEREEKLI